MCWKPKYEYELKQRIDMSIKEKAENYINKNELTNKVFPSDVVTTYECAYLQAESDQI